MSLHCSADEFQAREESSMWFRNFIKSLTSSSGRQRLTRRPESRLCLDLLEDRCVPASVTIGPGNSIQAAVDAAAPGTTIYLRSGTYYQSVEVNKPDIALV